MTARHRRRATVRAEAAPPRLSPLNQRRWAEFQGEQARLLVAVDLPRPVRPDAVRRIHRQRPADHRLLQGRDPVPCPGRLSGRKVRRLPGGHRLSRPDHPGRDRRPTAGWSGRRSATPTAPSTTRSGRQRRPSRPGDELEGRAAPRYPQGADDPNCTIGNWNWLGTDDQARDVLARVIYGFPHLRPVRPDPHARLGRHRRHRAARCRDISAAWSTCCSSV